MNNKEDKDKYNKAHLLLRRMKQARVEIVQKKKVKKMGQMKNLWISRKMKNKKNEKLVLELANDNPLETPPKCQR